VSDTREQQAEIERWVIEQCRSLKLPIGAVEDDIFDAGATSLTIIRLVARAEGEFGAEVLTPDDVIEFSSVHAIASRIRSNVTGNMTGTDTSVNGSPL
jgi:acyl carrier protein